MTDDTPAVKKPKRGGDGLYSKRRKGILPRYMFVKEPAGPNGQEQLERTMDHFRGRRRMKRRLTLRVVDTLSFLRKADK